MKDHGLIDLGFTIVNCIIGLNSYLNCIKVNTVKGCNIIGALIIFLNYKQIMSYCKQ